MWKPRQRLMPELGPVVGSVLFHDVIPRPPPPSDVELWREEAPLLAGHHLSGVALRAARAADITLPDDVTGLFRSEHLAQSLETLGVDALGTKLVHRLSNLGIPLVVTKGPGLAELYPDPADRTYVDLDAVVPRADFRRCLAVLRTWGFDESVHLQSREYFHRYCREAINLVDGEGSSLDLHHTIPPWYWGRRLDFATLLAGSREISQGAAKLRVAGPIHSLLVAALHVVSDKGEPGQSLRTWRDVAVLVTTCEPDRAAAEAHRLGLAWWLAFVVAELPECPARSELLGRLTGARPGRAERIRLRLLLPPTTGSRHLVGTVFRLPAPNALAFLAGQALPRRSVIESKIGPGASYRAWWSRSLQRLRSAREGYHGPGSFT